MVRRDGRHETVHGELLAHAIPIARCRVSGPDARICGEAPLPLALALHELAVNAIVHGAFPLTQAEIGDTLALSAVHVNRTLMEMRRLGLVTFQNRQASIHDFPLTPA